MRLRSATRAIKAMIERMDVDMDMGDTPATMDERDASKTYTGPAGAEGRRRRRASMPPSPRHVDDEDDKDDEPELKELSRAATTWARARSLNETMQTHLVLPHLISGYLQLVFNLAMIVFVGYVLHSFVQSVHSDIESRVAEYSADILGEIVECTKNHRANKCGTHGEVPVLRATCAMWERCMARDPTTVGRTRVSAQTLGQILNSFVDPLSYKTMGFFTIFLFGFMVASNLAFKLSSSPHKPPVFESHIAPPVAKIGRDYRRSLHAGDAIANSNSAGARLTHY